MSLVNIWRLKALESRRRFAVIRDNTSTTEIIHIKFAVLDRVPPHSGNDAVLCLLIEESQRNYLGAVVHNEVELAKVSCPKCRSIFGRYVRGEL